MAWALTKSQRSGASKKFFVQLSKHCGRICARQHHRKSFNRLWAGKLKVTAPLQAALDLKHRRDNRVPSAPTLCFLMCRAQPTTTNCFCSHQQFPTPVTVEEATWRAEKVSWDRGQMPAHHQVHVQEQIASCHKIRNDLVHLAELL